MVYTGEFIRCTACDKGFSGPESYQDHLLSKKHKRKVGSEEEAGPSLGDSLRCDLCDMKFSGPVPYAQHMEGSKHKSNINKQEIIANLPGAGEAATNNATTLYPSLEGVAPQVTANKMAVTVLKCELCGVCFSGPESMDEHLKSKGHNRKVEMKEMKEVLDGSNPSPTAPLLTENGGSAEDSNAAPVAAIGVPKEEDAKQEESEKDLLSHKHKKPVGCFKFFRCISSGKGSKKNKKRLEKLEKDVV